MCIRDSQYGDPFPSTLCTSVNDQVVHGIPNDIPLKEGDIVSVDCGTYMNGFCGDSAYTFCVGEVDPEVLKLLKTTKEALYLGIELSLIHICVSRIVIERTLKLVTITVCTARPGIIIGKGGQEVDKLKEELKKMCIRDSWWSSSCYRTV